MNKFKGLILFSDLDGTLFDDNTEIPERNEKNIGYFIKEGGLFSVATGRTHHSLTRFYDRLGINAPCVTQNGCCIYDYGLRKSLMSIYLNEAAKEAACKTYADFPDLNVVLFVESGLTVLRDPEGLNPCFDAMNVPVKTERPESAKEPWFKVGFVGLMERLVCLRAELEKNELGGAEIVYAGTDMMEVLPPGITKGNGMLSVMRQLGIGKQNVCAIGDFHNDLEMLENAGISATVEGAPDELKNLASFITCDSNLGSVGHFIEWLDERF